MPTFINTRPSQRAKPLTQALQSAGVDVLELPLLQIKPLALSENDKQKLAELAILATNAYDLTKTYDVLVVISPTAAELACQFLCEVLGNDVSNTPVDMLADIPVVAVGQATANKLAQFAITARIPSIANNEGMLALDCLANLNQQSRVMVWRGQGGRRLLIDELQKKGVTVDLIELYQRQLPTESLSILEQWLENTKQHTFAHTSADKADKPIVLISSGEVFANWVRLLSQIHQGKIAQQRFSQKQFSQQQLINKLPTTYPQEKPFIHRTTDFRYLALGERLGQIMLDNQLSYQQLESLSPEVILKALRWVEN